MTAPSPAPFLNLAGFTALWDGPPLTAQQQAIVGLLLQVASQWIYNNGPQGSALPVTDPTAQFVVWDVVSNAVRYQKYSKLSTFSRTTGHRMEGGSFDDPMKALEFTDNHKMLLGIPLRSVPMTSCQPNDFDADDAAQGWPTCWSDQFGNLGWDWWQYDND
ncbi:MULTISPECIES: hypothetical protein [Mycobacterium]|uniref:Uncharacterized protein n=2 Tax=Mycobacterium TaxID=1763 RepID=A0A2G5PQL9_MYCCE|nr:MULTISPECIES: hypothetical protein [Mycobacterium]MCV7232767.1 hypothetical protein [Mycobacterium branderi]ORA40905.1 hypothetical protein BST20_01790 [Mycobacterium branderi]PIB80559.1 hypothetical protein CQY23_03190 [Mycobacterium celatum]BBZ09865.1 hypothetical protein MBRA_00600 [Mycobacterium branderi]